MPGRWGGLKFSKSVMKNLLLWPVSTSLDLIENKLKYKMIFFFLPFKCSNAVFDRSRTISKFETENLHLCTEHMKTSFLCYNLCRQFHQPAVFVTNDNIAGKNSFVYQFWKNWHKNINDAVTFLSKKDIFHIQSSLS